MKTINKLFPFIVFLFLVLNCSNESKHNTSIHLQKIHSPTREESPKQLLTNDPRIVRQYYNYNDILEKFTSKDHLMKEDV